MLSSRHGIFPASDDTAWEFVKDVIRQSDYYAIIIGGRYGSVDERGLSFTEREYDLAYELKVPNVGILAPRSRWSPCKKI
jgi:hypothetical protein